MPLIPTSPTVTAREVADSVGHTIKAVQTWWNEHGFEPVVKSSRNNPARYNIAARDAYSNRGSRKLWDTASGLRPVAMIAAKELKADIEIYHILTKNVARCTPLSFYEGDGHSKFYTKAALGWPYRAGNSSWGMPEIPAVDPIPPASGTTDQYDAIGQAEIIRRAKVLWAEWCKTIIRA